MMTNSTVLALDLADRWQGFWRGNFGVWILDRGVRIALLLIGGLLAARFINWAANRVVRRIDAQYTESDQLVRSESTKHRQAVASVVSWVSVALLFVVVAVEVTDVLAIPVGSLVAPAAVLGAALGFGAQRIVQDLLAGFFIITEKQYGFGDLVSLTVAGITLPAEGTVEDVTLRVTKLRSTEGEMFTIPNGQIVKTLNLSKDWARAVVDIPVPTSADLNVVNDLLHDVADNAIEDPGAEGSAARRAADDGCGEHRAGHRQPADGGAHAARQAVRGRATDTRARRPGAPPRRHRRRPATGSAPMVAAIPHPSESCGRRGRDSGAHRSRSSDLVVQGETRPHPGFDRGTRWSRSSRCSGCSRPSSRSRPPKRPTPAVVPPGFVPDPNYTWVPRTNVRRPKDADTTTTTTTPTTTTTETTTPSPDTTTSPTSPTSPSPTTTVVDPDGPGGPLAPQTLTQTPASSAPITVPPVPGTVPASPEAPR